MAVKVSVVIPNYNGRKLLAKNLPAVFQACQNWGKDLPAGRQVWEIIVVDDASTDSSIAFLKKEYSLIKVVRHQQNQRFAMVCNSGVQAAQGEVVILLNNDVRPAINFLKPLLAHFENDDVFAVGCKEKQLKKGKAFFSGRGIMRFRRGLVVHWRAVDQDGKTTS